MIDCIKKYIKLVILAGCIIVLAVLARPYIYTYKFEQVLKEASKVPDTYDDRYRDMPVGKYKVVLVTNNGGEFSYAEYFKYSADKLGWEVKIYYNQLLGSEDEILKFNPDFILFSHHVNPNISQEISLHKSKKYIVSLLSLESMRKDQKFISSKNPYVPTGDFASLISMAHGVLTSEKEIDIYRIMFESMRKPFNGLRIFPLASETKNTPAEPVSIMWMVAGWDKFRSSNRYQEFITRISNDIPMKVYGKFTNAPYLKKYVYDGSMASSLEVSTAIRKNGIYLLTHSDSHIKSGVPTLRIFEAAAANAVVISDKHPFAMKHFGDNFLYFDQTADAETMYQQVKSHYDWIQANPEKAKAMASRAHNIFLEKFTLEKDLARIAKMHEYILLQEKEMGLSYPLSY
jgi:hypothetical protein